LILINNQSANLLALVPISIQLSHYDNACIGTAITYK